MIDSEIQTIAQKIFELSSSNRSIMWIGSGYSIPAGYPAYRSFLNKVCDNCGVQCIDIDNYSPNDILQKFDECKNSNIDSYKYTFKKEFKDNNITRNAYDFALLLPFRGFVTTNIDNSMESAAYTHKYYQKKLISYTYPYLSIETINTQYHNDNTNFEIPIFYIHGQIDIEIKKNDSDWFIVFSDQEFKDAYNDGIVSSFLEMIFTYYDILFMGCRLTEKYICDCLIKSKLNQEKIKKRNPKFKDSKKIILLDRMIFELENGEIKKQSEENFVKDVERIEQLGVEVLKFYPEEKNQNEIETILKKANDLVKINSQKEAITTSSEEFYGDNR